MASTFKSLPAAASGGSSSSVDVVSSVLPTGAATEATLSAVNTKTPALVSGRVPVDGSGVTQPVSASSLPLPTGAATAANQSTANTSLSSIDTKTPALVGGRQPVLAAGTNADGASSPIQLTENGAISVGNAYKKFRDGFAALAQDAAPSAPIWTEAWVNQGSSFRGRRGNAAGSAYMQVSLCPITAGSQYTLESIDTYRFPQRFLLGVSLSQRILGQEVEVSLVGADGSGVETLTPIADQPISGSISVTSNVATINFASAHPFRGGDRIILKGNADSRMNVGPVVVTVVTATQITVPLTIANASYTAGGSVQWADQFAYARNAGGLLFENATATNASFVTRRNGYNTRSLNSTIATTVATQSSTSPYSDAFNAAARQEFYLNQEEFLFVSRTQDGLSAVAGAQKWTQGIPDEEKSYRIRIRAKNLENLTVPVARIVSIEKTGTTTATVTTDVAHGLTTSDFVQIYGVRDQTNFPNLTAATAVASVPTSTTFTIVIGTASTTSSAGGTVFRNNGGVLAPGVFAQVVQSISRTNNVLTLVGSGTWATPLPGENVHLYGCDATSMGLYDGAYKVLRVNTTSLGLESVGADFGSINCGGAVMRRTDVRLHFVSQIEHTRNIVSIDTSAGADDGSRRIPVLASISSGTVTTVSTVTTVTGVTTVSTVTAGGLQIPITVADVASAALTTTTTVAAITPGQGTSYQVNIPVTVVSGTNPTLDVAIEESDDSGTNWYKVYDFPRITATGIYRSPNLRLQGNRVRYVQTVAGTSPSFTRAINRLQAHNPGAIIRQIIDRTIVPNTLNSTSPSLLVEGCQDFNVMVRCTAQTTAATIAIQFSHDGTNWHTSGTTVTTVNGIAHAKVQNEQWKFARLIVSAAGTGITLAEATLVGRGE